MDLTEAQKRIQARSQLMLMQSNNEYIKDVEDIKEIINIKGVKVINIYK